MESTKMRTQATGLKHFWETLTSLWSLIVGLFVTGKNFVKPTITVFYPKQTIEDDKLLSYRGHIELVPQPKDPMTPKCIMCMMCQKACPSACISIKAAKPPATPEGEEGDKKPKKQLASFDLDYNLCCLCGICVQNCPAKSLRHSNNIYLAGYSREEFEFDLLKRMRDQAQNAPATPEKAEKDAA